METITIHKHTLILGAAFLTTLLVGLCLGITIGTRSLHENRVFMYGMHDRNAAFRLQGNTSYGMMDNFMQFQTSPAEEGVR